jgi:hypothetical protein
MIDDILNAIPEEKKAALKPSLDKLVDVESLTAEQFADLLKTNTALNSIYQAELSRKNDRYAKEKVPELVEKALAEKLAVINPETDPEKIKVRLDAETDQAKRRELERELRIATLEKKAALDEAEKKQLQEIANTSKRKDALKMYITEKEYEGINSDSYACFDIDTAKKLIDEHAAELIKFKTDITERYKGLGNTAPGSGAQAATNRQNYNAALKNRDFKSALIAAAGEGK